MRNLPIAITADIHAHNWQEWSTLDKDGRNSRLVHCLECLDRMVDSVRGGTLIILGDLFDNRRHIALEVLHGVSTSILRALQRDVEIILLAGNHDQHLADGEIHSLAQFSEARVGSGGAKVVVVDKPGVFETRGGVPLFLHPWTEDLQALRTWIKEQSCSPKASRGLLGLHTVICGTAMNGGKIAPFGLLPEELCPNSFAQVWAGHHHKPQKFYVGSPYQLDRGERGSENRYLTWDTSTNEVTSVRLEVAPEFVDLTLDQVSTFSPPHQGAFVTLMHDVKQSAEAEKVAETALRSKGLRVALRSVSSPNESLLEIGKKSVEQNGFLTMEGAAFIALTSRNRQDLHDVAVKRLHEASMS